MFIEKMFGNTFGMVWLIIFTLSIFALLVWSFIKKEKLFEIKKELVKENYNGFVIEEKDDLKFDVKKEDGSVLKTFNNIADCKVFVDVLLLRNENNSAYEIVKIDGFFKVRKKESGRIIRKFTTEEDAENYIKEREDND
jgi:hypothetical protein